MIIMQSHMISIIMKKSKFKQRSTEAYVVRKTFRRNQADSCIFRLPNRRERR